MENRNENPEAVKAAETEQPEDAAKSAEHWLTCAGYHGEMGDLLVKQLTKYGKQLSEENKALRDELNVIREIIGTKEDLAKPRHTEHLADFLSTYSDKMSAALTLLEHEWLGNIDHESDEPRYENHILGFIVYGMRSLKNDLKIALTFEHTHENHTPVFITEPLSVADLVCAYEPEMVKKSAVKAEDKAAA